MNLELQERADKAEADVRKLRETLQFAFNTWFEDCACGEDREYPRCDFHACYDVMRAVLRETEVKP